MNITIRKIGDVVVFDVAGEFRRTEAKEPWLPGLVSAQIKKGNKKFLVCLEKVEFIDRYGIGDILASYLLVLKRGGGLKLAPFPGRYSTGKVESLFDPLEDFLYASLDNALEAFRAAR
jgi:hypothetical protein